MVKKLLICLLATALAFSLWLTPSYAAEERVYDFADILTAAEENALEQRISELRSKYPDMDIVILTSTELEYTSSDSLSSERGIAFAEDFYVEGNFGVGERYDGIIIFIDMTNRMPHIVCCGSTNTFIYADRREYILEDMHDDLASGDYKGAFDISLDGYQKYRRMGWILIEPGEIIIAAIGGVAVAFFFSLGVKRKYRMAGTQYSYSTADNTTVNITRSEDIFSNTRTVRVPRSTGSSGGGGGFGGGGGGGGGHSFGGSSGGRF